MNKSLQIMINNIKLSIKTKKFFFICPKTSETINFLNFLYYNGFIINHLILKKKKKKYFILKYFLNLKKVILF
jgi:ribosomal protein S8